MKIFDGLSGLETPKDPVQPIKCGFFYTSAKLCIVVKRELLIADFQNLTKNSSRIGE